MTTITTVYLPPTDTTGSRFRATSARPRRQVTVPYEYADTAFQNHYAAAVTLADRIMPDWSSLVCRAGDAAHGPRGYTWDLS